MEDEKILILKEFLSKLNINDDYYINLFLQKYGSELNNSELSRIINLIQLEQEERDSSYCYRIHGNLNIIASNVLFNMSGDSSYEKLVELKDLDEESETFVNELTDVLFEKNGWFYYTTGSSCENIYMEPIPERFMPLDRNGYDNWSLYLTYPYSSSTDYLSFEGVSIGDGIAIFDAREIIVSSRPMTLCSTTIKHGLNAGDIINISSDVITGLEGQFSIYKLGDEFNNSQAYTFVIDFTPTSYLPNYTGTKLRMKKTTGGVESEYMVRFFKKISIPSDYEMFNLAYANNKFWDSIYGFNFKEDINLEDLTDYLGRPVTEIYLSIFKSLRDTKSLSNFWERLFSGLYNFKSSGDYSVNTLTNLLADDYAIESNIIADTTDTFFGDIVEYNSVTLEENILAEALYVFNTKNRVQNNLLEGYYYKPHYKIRVKYFSDYIEESTSQFVTAIPEYAQELDGKYIWRDILTHSFVNDSNIPFINGCHYIFDNFIILVKRQDPCGNNNFGFQSLIDGKCVDLTIYDENINEINC